MSKKARMTRRRRSTAPVAALGPTIIDFIKRQLAQPDRRSDAEFLADMRAAPLANPATAALLDRLERVI